MSTTTAFSPPLDEWPPVPVRRFTVEEYQRMTEIGLLTPEDRVELLEGWIVPKAAQEFAAEPLTPPGMDDPPPVPVRRFTVEEYQRMAEVGILTEEDRVELLEGWIVPKMTRNPPHDAVIQIIGSILRGLLPSGWSDRIQACAVTTCSQPEPDVAIVRGGYRDFLTNHPDPQDVGLIVEVAESSLASDRGLKATIYARSGIPVYWIVNLIDGQLEVLTDPTGPAAAPAYRSRQVLRPDDEVSFLLDGTEIAKIAVSELLP